MGDWYLGELRVFAFGIVPQGWLPCQGQLLPIQQNAALYSLLGTQYGGNGVNNFALPDLRGRVGVSQGASASGTQYICGNAGGVESVALSVSQILAHTHIANGTSAAASINKPPGALLASAAGNALPYKPYNPGSQTTLAAGSVLPAGGGVPHENRQPFLALNVCIAMQGIYPSRP